MCIPKNQTFDGMTLTKEPLYHRCDDSVKNPAKPFIAGFLFVDRFGPQVTS
jgi:hypothetical protein